MFTTGLFLIDFFDFGGQKCHWRGSVAHIQNSLFAVMTPRRVLPPLRLSRKQHDLLSSRYFTLTYFVSNVPQMWHSSVLHTAKAVAKLGQ